MVQLDWKRLLSLSPEDLSEEEKDDLYGTLIWYTPEPNIDAEHLKVLFTVTQDVLKYKGEQVESLVVELDDLAMRQGEEEARRHQNLIEEIEELKAQLVLSKRNESHISGEGTEIEELRQELVKCEMHNEELLTELKARERDISTEKRESEKFAGQVAQLEREKLELQRELIALQNESTEQRNTVQHLDSPEKQQEMAELIRQKNKHISQLLNDVEEQNIALRTQVQELVEQKLRRDSQLDDFSEALDSRVEEWKTLQIGVDPTAMGNLKNQLQQAEQKIQLLESKLKDAEEDAHTKAQEATEMIIQLREYESGEYGLAEAVSEIKELRQQCRVRDKQIEELVQASNKLQSEAGQLEEQNLAFREQLGMPEGSPIRVDGILAQRKKEQLLMKVLQQQAERLEEEKLQLKLEGKLKEMTDENEALRKGMHEILDSIHNQDEVSTVQVESQSLERLLEALDLRHVSGWYHPAMRLQAQLNSVEGSNAVLREQLRLTRGSQSSQKLQKALLRIEQLEQNSEIQNPMKAVVCDKLKLPSDIPLSSAEIISKLNMHLLHVINEYEKEEEQNKQLEKKLEELNKNFSIMRHQMGLLYKQHSEEKSDWKKLQTDLEKERENLKEKAETLQVKLNEYEQHWTALGEGEEDQKKLMSESAQQIAVTMANNVVLERKCKALQNLENQLRKENNKLKDDIASIECMVTQRIGELQRHKSMLQESVPLTTMEVANKQYNELITKYRDLLQKEQTLVCESRLAARLEAELAALQKDKEELQNALQQAREKVHSLEILIEAVNKDTISLLSKKLATIELKELGERQRADHADKMYNILKGQLTQLEERNAELESQSNALVQQNLELQQVERDLRDNLLTFVSRDELQDVQNKLRKCEQEKVFEKDQLKEISDIAQDQIRNLELWKLSQEYQLDYMRRQILELQSTSDERSVIAKLNHELLSSRLSESASHKKVQQLQNEISKLRSHSLRQEVQLDEKEQALNHLKTQLTTRCRSLHQVIQDLRRQYSGSVPLSTHERLVFSLRRLGDERRVAIEKMHVAMKTAHEAVTAREEAELLLNSLQELKAAIYSPQEHKQLIEWHNKNTELRLKELKSRRQAEMLQSELMQTEERLHRLENHVATLEQQQISTERDFEQAQLAWEQMQSELYKQLAEYEMAVGVKKSHPEPEPAVIQADNPVVDQLKQALSLVSSQSQSLLKYEAELAQLRSKVSSLTQQLEEKDLLLLAKEKTLSEMQVQLLSSRRTAPTLDHPPEDIKLEEDNTEKLALKATIESLHNIVNQKEETIGRYQKLLKESRDEHSQAAEKFQEELHNLHISLNTLQQTHSKLKSRLRNTSPSRKPIQNMVDQLEEQHNAELVKYKEESQRYHLEAESAKQDLGLVQEELKKQVEAAQRGPSAVMQNCITMLKNQLKQKEAQEQLLQQTISDLQ
ncbi:hypothetical protein L9F63_008521, partial [Diploptera punctata]